MNHQALLLSIIAAAVLQTAAAAATTTTTCPPKVVSSYQEVGHYCTSRISSGHTYQCLNDDNEVICKGSIHNHISPPACSNRNITSCTDEQYYSVCSSTHKNDGGDNKNCGIRHEPHVFTCWDKQAHQWCQGDIIPTKGTWDDPTCPEVAVKECGELEDYGIHSNSCNCMTTTSHGGGEGSFECHKDDEMICQGRIIAGGVSTQDASAAPSNEEEEEDASVYDDDTSISCPPPIVSTLEEVNAYYCVGSDETSASQGDTYECKSKGRVVCHGTIDENHVPPPCTQNITSCALNDDYFEVCRKEENELFMEANCNNPSPTGERTFRCWDKVQDEWCQGYIILDGEPAAEQQQHYYWCPPTITATYDTFWERWNLENVVDSEKCNAQGMNIDFGIGVYECNFVGGYSCTGVVEPPPLAINDLITSSCPPTVATSWSDVRLYCGTSFDCITSSDGSSCLFGCASCADETRDGEKWSTGHYKCTTMDEESETTTCRGSVNVTATVDTLELPTCKETLASCSDDDYFAFCQDEMGPEPPCPKDDPPPVFGPSCTESWQQNRAALKLCYAETFKCRPKNGDPVCLGKVETSSDDTASVQPSVTPTVHGTISPSRGTKDDLYIGYGGGPTSIEDDSTNDDSPEDASDSSSTTTQDDETRSPKLWMMGVILTAVAASLVVVVVVVVVARRRRQRRTCPTERYAAVYSVDVEII